jgi:hypothetical protein
MHHFKSINDRYGGRQADEMPRFKGECCLFRRFSGLPQTVFISSGGAIKSEVQHLPRVRCAHAKKKNVSTASA